LLAPLGLHHWLLTWLRKCLPSHWRLAFLHGWLSHWRLSWLHRWLSHWRLSWLHWWLSHWWLPHWWLSHRQHYWLTHWRLAYWHLGGLVAIVYLLDHLTWLHLLSRVKLLLLLHLSRNHSIGSRIQWALWIPTHDYREENRWNCFFSSKRRIVENLSLNCIVYVY